MDMKNEIVLIKADVKELQESMEKMTVCATVMKNLVEKAAGVNIDKLVEEEMKKKNEG